MKARASIIPILLVLLSIARTAEARQRVAVLDFAAVNAPRGIATAVRDLFEVSLHKTGSAELIERTRVQLVLKERRLTDAACSESSCAVDIGRILRADAVVIGGVNRIGGYLVTVKVVDIASGRIGIAESARAPGENEIAGSVELLAQKIAGRMGGGISGPASRDGNGGRLRVDILAGMSYIAPLFKLARLYRPGFEASVELGLARLAAGFSMGIDAGYMKNSGKAAYVTSCMSVPLRIFAGYQFYPAEWLYLGITASGGVSYNAVTFNKIGAWYGHPSGTGMSFEPALRCSAGIGFVYRALHIRISGLYDTVFEASEALCSAGATIEIGVRI